MREGKKREGKIKQRKTKEIKLRQGKDEKRRECTIREEDEGREQKCFNS